MAPKTKFVSVIMQSLATGKRFVAVRGRLEPKLEQVRWDPNVRQEVIYKEVRKLKSIKDK